MHDEIRKFSLEGELGEPNIVETKERLIMFVENVMREQGYVPTLDNEPQMTLDYNAERGAFDFKLTVYGIKLKEKERAWEVAGMMTGKEIPKYTPQAKSLQSQNSAE